MPGARLTACRDRAVGAERGVAFLFLKSSGRVAFSLQGLLHDPERVEVLEKIGFTVPA
jgi:hypothetical protein